MRTLASPLSWAGCREKDAVSRCSVPNTVTCFPAQPQKDVTLATDAPFTCPNVSSYSQQLMCKNVVLLSKSDQKKTKKDARLTQQVAACVYLVRSKFYSSNMYSKWEGKSRYIFSPCGDKFQNYANLPQSRVLSVSRQRCAVTETSHSLVKYLQ